MTVVNCTPCMLEEGWGVLVHHEGYVVGLMSLACIVSWLVGSVVFSWLVVRLAAKVSHHSVGAVSLRHSVVF
jgi:hypothetical protein